MKGLILDKKFSEKLNQLDELTKTDKNSFAALSQYIPVHKTGQKSFNNDFKKSSPFEEKKSSPKTTFSMYDSEYLQNKFPDNLNLKNNNKNSIWKLIKFLFFNLPIINIIYMKFRESKIKETISAIDSMSMDIDTYTAYLQNNAFLYKTKFSKKLNSKI